MQEINRAYEVLGNEELRKRYDLGETQFTFTASESNYSHEEELKNISDELKRLREEQKILARKDVINIVDFEMLITEIFPSKLERINNPYFDKTKSHAIEAIEEAMKEKDLKSQNNQTDLAREVNNLKQLVQQLEKEVNQLKAEIQELKKENDNSPELNSYLTKKESELQSKQSKLGQLRSIVEIGSSESKKPKSDNKFPTGLVVGGVINSIVSPKQVIGKELASLLVKGKKCAKYP
ncbi:9084_t:CDS:2 [Ambispora gerdemannii]|uniref:9084_t:CDS:1 n=1 Tax=Ambispora gerdemannii TaxID=144530 RepID=A0A9N8YUC7_9GLOM|nr:9084_t:CDS:2 [Ambispora gerdemannii]